MYKAIAEIKEEFEKENLNFNVEQKGEHWLITLTLSGDVSNYRFLFIKTNDEGNDVAVRVFNVLEVPEKKRKYMIRALNDLTGHLNYTKLTLDEDNTLTASYDFVGSFSPIGPGAFEVLLRMTKELEVIYPLLASVAG